MKKSILLVSMLAGLVSTSAVAGDLPELENLVAGGAKLRLSDKMHLRGFDFEEGADWYPSMKHASPKRTVYSVLFVDGHAYQMVFNWNKNDGYTKTEFYDVETGNKIDRPADFVFAGHFGINGHGACDLSIDIPQGETLDLKKLFTLNKDNGFIRSETIGAHKSVLSKGRGVNFRSDEDQDHTVTLSCDNRDYDLGHYSDHKNKSDFTKLSDIKKITGNMVDLDMAESKSQDLKDTAKKLAELSKELEKLTDKKSGQEISDETRKNIVDAQDSTNEAQKTIDKVAKSAK